MYLNIVKEHQDYIKLVKNIKNWVGSCLHLWHLSVFNSHTVYHYQIKVLVMNVLEQVKASVSIALIGSEGESPYIPITL